MDFLTIVMLSIALAMDCFAVSLTRGALVRQWQGTAYLLMALSFGFFQAMMPLIGYLVGYSFTEVIEDYDHWIAFGILAVLGIKMIVEDCKSEEEQPKDYGWKTVLMLSFATSIDALATGLVFLPCPDSLFLGISSIGVGSFVLSLLGCYLGVKVGQNLKFKFGLMGGVILILIGVRILIEHLFFA